MMTLKHKRIEWKAQFNAWKESGQSIAEWCRDQDIKVHQMYYWVQQFETNEISESGETKWLTVQADEEPFPLSGQGPILLHYGEMSIEVRPGANLRLLSDVVHVLQSQC